MTFFPVVERELRVASRRWTTYWGRALAAFAATGVAIYALAINDLMSGGLGAESGKIIFWGLSGVGMAFAAFCGVSHTADTISRERREGTLGLLFLTDLSGVDVTLGKLTSSSFGALYGLIAFQPVMAMSLLLGGITGGEYARMSLLLGTTLMASLGLGLAASSFAESSRTSSMLAFGFILMLGAILPLTGVTTDHVLFKLNLIPSDGQFLTPVLGYCSPLAAFASCSDVDFRITPFRFLSGLGTTFGFGFIGFAAAAYRLPRVWQDKPLRHGRSRLQKWFTSGDSAPKWAALLDTHPIAWLAERHFTRRIVPWVIVIGGLLGFGGFAWWDLYQQNSSDVVHDFTFLLFATGTVQTAFKFWVSNESGRQLLEDRRSGGLELQLAAPVTVKQIVNGHLLAVWRMARWPLLLVALADVIAFFYMANLNRGGSSDDYEVPLVIARAVLFWIDLETLAWVGLDAAMVSRNGRAANGVIAKVLLVPWSVIITGMMLLAFFLRGTAFGSGFEPSSTLFALIWTVACIGNDLFWRLGARRRLMTEFRERAAVPLDANPGLWIFRIFKRA